MSNLPDDITAILVHPNCGPPEFQRIKDYIKGGGARLLTMPEFAVWLHKYKREVAEWNRGSENTLAGEGGETSR